MSGNGVVPRASHTPLPRNEESTAPLRDALRDLLDQHPEAASALMKRLLWIAAEGKPHESLKAIEMLFNRIDGPVMKEIQDAITPIQVTLQNIQLKTRNAERIVEQQNGGPELED